MKAQKQALVPLLLDLLAPQLTTVVPAGAKLPKALRQAIGRLAEHMVRLQAKQAKRAARAATPTAKQERQQLTGELEAVLDAHFAKDGLAEQETQLLSETAAELATKLTKLRRQQSRPEKEPAGEVKEPVREEEQATPEPEKRTRRRAQALPAAE